MRLKKIKLAGFKSFVDPTSIPFPDDMTAIVGPNGCGKSNVIDAVRWVLGESSAKNLRGDAMTDVIFNGSTARKPVSQCSVELVFDNSSGRIQGEYAKYNELSVKRLVTRDGQSNYFLNASKCRRRDVTDLFLGTGLGPRSYAIIEQGMISRLIESKPQELRIFIEEAAGISKYKERRRETETRIRHCRDNLERLNDVRGELGQQLEKLQRQAAAAKRYKELKAKERKLKAELAALRWLKHSSQITELEQAIAQRETEIEEIVARQRGDERGMADYQEKVADLKQQLADVQQQVFHVGNQITRLEQTQIHARQRQQQIAQELEQLQHSLQQLQQERGQEQESLELISASLSELEPEQELLLEQQHQAQLVLHDAEQQWQDQQDTWRRQEQDIFALKQQVQSRQTQIQSLQTLYEREQQRLAEMQQSLAELQESNQDTELQQQEKILLESKAALEQAGLQLSEAEKAKDDADVKVQEHKQMQLTLSGQQQHLQANLSALTAMQQSSGGRDNAVQAWLAELPEQPKSAWQWLEVEQGWEKALETVMGDWLAASVIEDGKYPDIDGSAWLLAQHMSTDKPVGTLASKIKSERVPDWLTRVQIADENRALESQLDGLAEGRSLINKQGHWLGLGWVSIGSRSNQQGILDRAKQIQQLQDELNALLINAEQHENEMAEAQQMLLLHREQSEQAQRLYRQLERDCIELEQRHRLLVEQRELRANQTHKLQGQIVQLEEQLDEDKIKQETLAAELEELQLQLDSQSDSEQYNLKHREDLQRQLSVQRAQVDELRSKVHQMALQVQGLQSRQQHAQQNSNRLNHALQSAEQRRVALIEEQMHWQSPFEEQTEQLQELLAQRLLLEDQQADLSAQLQNAQAELEQVQKGQQGITERIGQLREVQQSLKLEAEGAKVRANAVLEQLQEMNQPLKPVLETLDEAADEKVWQEELDKTQASVSRLGAVNLAAVEEYDIQSERKQHLDEQHEDLTGALDTLEGAIRKIDKETRSRFRDTFDKVNEDLKMLFPKVFGGGSAYLELTDDDLLETGVTIMARPPGKKNSTIHLLSGGEKALTALSLVFAIFRLNPAPFCLLDEVDAPLDDANVGRFCKLVSEMSKTVQFIYITHNKIAMEMATHLTGVTMAEPGVSRMVAVDVDEAVALAEL
ncbi:chromosome segregation protein SMC [Bowmanella sp. Y26]|uniref:chromosome segregation protein SMC n=1 Tax=Bowmanella yangjiangensis TaxID=2811230 RepID=UPI001BDDA1BC|nr:chromosome segregation protein SMC [Bowmanella yangjiangensis]MBT1063612.1 chromosome segregation protein SMC [Bowmanella yangjiangensis]